MKEKITLATLVGKLALQGGASKKESEDFLKEFFSLIKEGLLEDGIVKIKNFGVFKTVDVEARKSVNVSTGEDNVIPSHKKIVFIPSKELAEKVNVPFSMFETVELADDTAEFIDVIEADSSVEADLSVEADSNVGIASKPVIVSSSEDDKDANNYSIYTLPEDASESDSESMPMPKPESKNVLECAVESKPELKSETESEPETEAESEPKPEPESKSKSEPEPEPEMRWEMELITDQELEAEQKRSKWKSPLLFMAGLLAGMILAVSAFFLYNRFYSADEVAQTDVTVEENTQPATLLKGQRVGSDVNHTGIDEQQNQVKTLQNSNEDAADIVATEPSDKKTYDTISTTRYLTTMAKDHYGNYHLWPYIYMENASFLGHPDRIKPGTKVVIPDLKKYGVDSKNPEDIAIAKKKGVEIYSRYK
ncbi:MAG: HU family DNA-binding protein [Candidatus Amulumruptor caecigallinarius]|nr:HU family DNA-binding protein [Candidatus Amulumruptor caecigallinarius]